MRKKKGKNIIWIYFITFILFFSILGVGYGQFNENLNVDVNVTTGYIDPSFDESIGNYLKPLNDGENIVIKQGKLDTETVDIYNNGTIPIKLVDVKCDSDGLNIQGISIGDVIDPKGSIKDIAVRIHPIENYHELRLIFKQYTPSHKKEKNIQHHK